MMSAFCRFYSMTPTEYRALAVRDFVSMQKFMTETIKQSRG